MPKVKDNEKLNDKISRENHFPQVAKICFGFSHLTTNNDFGLKGFENKEAYADLIGKLVDWSGINVSEARQRGKKLGLERIPYNQLSKPMQGICDNSNIVSKGGKVVVFQFYNHQYRLICKEDMIHANILHVLAFDFHFLAYNHG
ncbi:hypothetical protein ACTQZS_14490 [Bilifractor sp. LCP19S3_H10]|uniref:hypothetical protein n=1 Tax=Bilifractor sp. LCP19S3_H10 TaxID=3438736 RepID=UPI003F9115B9